MQRIAIRLRWIALALMLSLGSQQLAHAVEGARQYTVKQGETLGGISSSLGVPVSRLVALNKLADADQIMAGQVLLLPEEGALGPEPPAASASSSAREYIVRSGDVLSQISAEAGMSVAALIQANALTNPDQLTVGQKLTLPGGQSGAQVAAPARQAPAGGSSQVGVLLEDAAARHKLDASLVKATAWYLSAWRPDAGSPANSFGIMQITSSTQEWVSQALLKRAVDRADPGDNIEIGVAYLAHLIGKSGDERQGLAAYLQGPGGVARNGVSSATAKAIDAIDASRGRFGTAGPASSASLSPPANAGSRDLAAVITSAVSEISPRARVGLSARNLTTGEKVQIRAGEAFRSASVNKVAILTEVFRQISAGKLTRGPAVANDIENMIVLSDNDAANRLLDTVGERTVNATMSSLGLNSTVLRNYFSANRGPLDPGFNQTSPADAAALFHLLATDKLISQQASQEMRGLLLRAQDGSKLARGLPPGTRLAHKSGWYASVANDVGIVYAPRATYVIAVFSEGNADNEAGNQVVATASRAIYDAWGKAGS